MGKPVSGRKEGSKRKGVQGKLEKEGRKEGRKEPCRHVSSYSITAPGASARGRNPGGLEAPENPCCNQKYHVTSKGELCKIILFPKRGRLRAPQIPLTVFNSIHASFSCHFFGFRNCIIFIIFHEFS